MNSKNNGQVFVFGLIFVFLLFTLPTASAFCQVTGHVWNSTGGQANYNVQIWCDSTLLSSKTPNPSPQLYTFQLGTPFEDCTDHCSGSIIRVNATGTGATDSLESGEISFAAGTGPFNPMNFNLSAPPSPTYHNSVAVNTSYGSEEVSIYWNMSDDGAVDGTIGGNFSYNSSNDSTVTTGGAFTTGGTKAFSNFSSMSAGTVVYWWSVALGEGIATVSEVFQFTIQKLTNVVSLIVPSGGWTQTYPASGNINCSENTGGQVTPTAFRNGTSIGLTEGVSDLSAGSYNITCNASESENYTADSESQTLTITRADPGVAINSNGTWSVSNETSVNISCSVATTQTIPINLTAANGSVVASGNNYAEFIFTFFDGVNEGIWNCSSGEVENYSADLASNTLSSSAFAIENVSCSNDSANYYDCSTFSYGDSITHIRTFIRGIENATDVKFNLRNVDDVTNYINNESNTSVSGNYAIYATGGYLLRDSGDWELNVTAYGPEVSVNSQSWSYSYGQVEVDWISPSVSGNIDWLEITNVNVNVSCVGGECGALNSTLFTGTQTSTVSGTTPFYTINSNPQSVSALYGGSSVTRDWDVNTTGNLTDSYDFYVDLNMTTNTGNVNDNTSSRLSMEIYYNDTTNPVIGSVSVSPSVIINGSSVTIDMVSSDNIAVDKEWVNLTYPNGTSVLFDLPKTFSDTEESGQYNLTYFVNDTTGNEASESRWFGAAEPLNASINISLNLNASSNFTVKLIHPEFGDVILEMNTNDSFYANIPDVVYDIMFLSAFNDSMNLTLRQVNLSANINESIKLDRHKQLSDFMVVYGIDTGYGFSVSELVLSYAGESFSTEANLKLWKCDGVDYDYDNRICTGSWTDITSGASQDVGGDYFIYNTTNFSGFAIKEYVPVDGGTESSPEGGGSTVTCILGYEYVVGEGCVLIEEPVKDVIEGIPSELFDIRMDLEDTVIDFASELEAVVVYESFGTIPTPVDLTFEVYDMSGNLLYSKDGHTIVTIEEVARYTFSELELTDGEYEFVFTTLYNVDVKDEFRQRFTVSEKGFITGNVVGWFGEENNKYYGLIIVGSLILLLFTWLIIKGKMGKGQGKVREKKVKVSDKKKG